MQLMRWQTLHDYRTRLLIKETQYVKKSRMKLGEEPHAAHEPRVGHPCYIGNFLCFALPLLANLGNNLSYIIYRVVEK